MQNFVGKQIDRYRIIAQQGVGGMAVVYKAYDTRLERDVALKLIRISEIPESQHERLLKRFEREAKTQAKFTHPNIVPIHDYGEHEGTPYLVMAYLASGTLKDRLGASMDLHNALESVLPIADALGYAHSMGVLHRDVKPSNILFDPTGRPILTDFGIAKILENTGTTLTGTGLGVGTPEYMAPEQWQGKASEASDQYSMGVVLYELLTGQKPFTAETPLAVALKVMSDPLPKPSSVIASISESVEKVLYKALARDPGDRYEDMGALKKVLEGLLEGERSKAPEPVKKVQPAAKPLRKPVVDSEGETRDVLEPTPVEAAARKQLVKPAGHKVRSGKRLPSWLPWSLLGVLVVVLVLVLALWGRGRDGPEPTEVAEVQEELADEMPPTLTEMLEPSLTHTATEKPTRTATVTLTPPESLGVSTMINPKDGAEMVYVPEGEFLMGREGSDAGSDEDPEHNVTLDAYWIYKHEVTNAEYAAFLNDQGNQEERGVTWLDPNDDNARITQSDGEWLSDSGYGDHPVVEVSWYGAQAYCEWAGGRLPTEAEWEKAARGEDGRTYPWGEGRPTCSLAQDSRCPGNTVPVGSFPQGASPYGALDMAGNVLEWVGDWYDADYYDKSPGSNPKGPGSGVYRVLRGGSWSYNVWCLRASYRYRNYPGNTNYHYGFRCFRSEAPSN